MYVLPNKGAFDDIVVGPSNNRLGMEPSPCRGWLFVTFKAATLVAQAIEVSFREESNA